MRLVTERTRHTPPLLVIPAYFRPESDPEAWESIAASAPKVRAVILNVANGPGGAPDPLLYPPLDQLRCTGVTVIGYVDSDYGVRPTSRIMADIDRFRRWYDVAGVCLDRASGEAGHLDHYAALARGARDRGADYVFFNHGIHPVRDYADHADLLGTFEGSWHAYRALRVPRWTRSREPGQFYHVVHSVPRDRLAAALRLAARRHAGCAYVTDRGGLNPYDGLPPSLLERRTPPRGTAI